MSTTARSQVSLGDFLTRSYEWVEPEPEQIYKRITARLWGKGLTLRAKVSGSIIAAARQLRAQSGQLLVSRIDARHGAFGIVPDELGGALVSNDFPCFDIDARLVIPRYFEWYSRTSTFVDLCRRASEGSINRVRLKENRFLDMRIPLPLLDEQRRIVARLDHVAGLIEERGKAVVAANADMQALLSKAVERAIEGAPRRPMIEVAPLVRRPVEIKPDRMYTEIGVRSFYNGIFHRRTMLGSEFNWQKLFWIKEGDLVFSNLMAWEQAIAVASTNDEGSVGNHRMLSCEVNPQIAIPRFLMAYFRTSDGLASILGSSPGMIARNKTLSSGKLPTIEVPVPSLNIQHWFDHILAKVHHARLIRDETAQDIVALSSAMLREVFGGEGHATP